MEPTCEYKIGTFGNVDLAGLPYGFRKFKFGTYAFVKGLKPMNKMGVEYPAPFGVSLTSGLFVQLTIHPSLSMCLYSGMIVTMNEWLVGAEHNKEMVFLGAVANYAKTILVFVLTPQPLSTSDVSTVKDFIYFISVKHFLEVYATDWLVGGIYQDPYYPPRFVDPTVSKITIIIEYFSDFCFLAADKAT